jgi:hypothetical protein
VRADGQKVLLAIKNMGGESTEAWRAVLDDLIKRWPPTTRVHVTGLIRSLAVFNGDRPQILYS